jgi:hypothetical protein
LVMYGIAAKSKTNIQPPVILQSQLTIQNCGAQHAALSSVLLYIL